MEESPELAERILQQTSDAVVYANRDGMIERWNPAAGRLFGYTAAEALGQSIDLIVPERLRAAHWTGFHRAVASGATRLAGRPALTRAVHQSGRKIYVEMSFALVKDEAGQVLGSVAVARDVTERVERERGTTGG